MNTGELIRSYRKRKGLTMKELGNKVGVSEQAISQYERSIRTPNVAILRKICSFLNLPVEDVASAFPPIPTSEDIDINPNLVIESQIEQFFDDVDKIKIKLMCKLFASFNYSLDIDENIVNVVDNVTDSIYATIPRKEFIGMSEVFYCGTEGLINNLKYKYSCK